MYLQVCNWNDYRVFLIVADVITRLLLDTTELLLGVSNHSFMTEGDNPGKFFSWQRFSILMMYWKESFFQRSSFKMDMKSHYAILRDLVWRGFMLLLIARELRIQTKEQKFNCYSVEAFVAVLHLGRILGHISLYISYNEWMTHVSQKLMKNQL